MKILVIIVTYNAMQWAERCLSSLKKSTVSPDIFVVDNGSTDGTQKYIKENYPEVMFHQTEENLGFGKANNMGMQYALDHNYDYVYLLNQDAWVLYDTIERLIDICKNYPEYGIISPFQMNADLKNIDACFIENTLAWKSNEKIWNDVYNNQIEDIYTVEWVMAAHWFITKKCLLLVGGFSPSFSLYGEDDNYVDRLHYWNIKIGVTPKLKVVHDRGWRKDSDTKKMYLNYTKTLRALSNPKGKTFKSIMSALIICFSNIDRYHSFKPLYYLWKIISNYFFIARNKKTSMEEKCAFLNIPNSIFKDNSL